MGSRLDRTNVGQNPHRRGRSLRGTDGRRVVGQPAGLQLDPAARGEDLQAVLVSHPRDRRIQERQHAGRGEPGAGRRRDRETRVQRDRSL